mmetsp:Transcript_33711/g.61019  ORF Transcript_33711/g.61019 Transcript_33711/m.61019 type:complete len:303 (-) Transcript_33711:1298-2206(-)
MPRKLCHELLVLLASLYAQPHFSEVRCCLVHLIEFICPDLVHPLDSRITSSKCLQFRGSGCSAPVNHVLTHSCVETSSANTTLEDALDVCSCSLPGLQAVSLIPFRLDTSPGLMLAESTLNCDCRLHQVGPLVSHQSPGKATANQRLALHCCTVQFGHLRSCVHTCGMALDGHRSPVLSEYLSHQYASHVPLNAFGSIVQLDSSYMVGLPVGLNHGGSYPSCDEPIRVLLAVLVPRPPCPLNSLGCYLPSPLILLLIHSVWLPTSHDLVSIAGCVPGQRPLHNACCSSRALDHTIRPEVIGS